MHSKGAIRPNPTAPRAARRIAGAARPDRGLPLCANRHLHARWIHARTGLRRRCKPKRCWTRDARESKYGLSKEMAIDLNALVRVHASAVLPKAVGHLDDNEMRVMATSISSRCWRVKARRNYT